MRTRSEALRHRRVSLGTVGEAMTRDVVTIGPDESLGIAARTLEAAGVSGGPVIEHGKIVGVATLGDLFAVTHHPSVQLQTTGPFLRREHILDEVGASLRMTVRDVMTRTVVTVRAGEPIERAAQLMTHHHVNRLPVVDEAGAVCGIVSRDDVVEAVATSSAEHRDQDGLLAAIAAD